ncbi:MAG: phosphoglycerate dehydrogenase-like enzyme [Gammaproteobacteria bacterium]|jgi:phosphoglycerate dehydrogenase-like enzyme
MKIAILDDYLDCALQLAPFQSLSPEHDLTVFKEQIPAERCPETLQDFDVLLIMRERTAFPRELIQQLPNLKLIVTTGRRNDVVDLDACKEANITVCGTDSPGYGTAELTFSLILAAAKGLIPEHNQMQSGGWQSSLGGNLKGRTLGIIGLGRIGGLLAGYANAMDMNVIAWSTNLTIERTKECSAEWVTKEELLSRSDFISIHLRLSERTNNLICAAELALMQEGAWIVNTSRAQIIHMGALIQELKTGRINAALDVYETEPLPVDSEIRKLSNIILSPHKGYASIDTFRVFYQQTYENLLGWLDGNVINQIY